MSSGGPIASKGVATGRGHTVATKGLISRFAAPAPPPPGPQGERLVLSITRLPIQIIVPTALNSVLMVVENIVSNLKQQQAASLTLPSMYKRAYLVAYETDEIAVVTP